MSVTFTYLDLFTASAAAGVAGVAGGIGVGAWLMDRRNRRDDQAPAVQPPDHEACGQICALASLPRDTDIVLRPRRRTPPPRRGDAGELYTHRA